jgi:murein DD-endopeptidase MepM/ murein hydrolase activator NlpD
VRTVPGEQDLLINDPWRQLGRRYSQQERSNILPQIEITRPGPDTQGFYDRLKASLNVSQSANRLSETLAANAAARRQLEEAKYLQNQWGSVDLSGVNPQYLEKTSGGSGTRPSGVPLQGRYRTTSSYGMRKHPVSGITKLHDGIDFGVPMGTPIYATHSGKVIESGFKGAWGYQVLLGGSGGITSRYAHQSRLTVKAGQYVNRGQIIGYSGSSGSSTGPHLHYAVYVGGRPVNPNAYF